VRLVAGCRLKKGLDAVTGEEVTDGSQLQDESSTVAGTYRSSSFDVAPPGYVAPPPGAAGWLAALLPSAAAADTDVAPAVVDVTTTASDPAGISGTFTTAERVSPPFPTTVGSCP